jgi:single-strand DNA-binding protein
VIGEEKNNMNVVMLTARLTKDVELRYTPQGKAVATFSVAVDRPYAKDQTDFFNIVVWGKTAENCSNFIGKGRLVAIRGMIQNRSYDDNNGAKKYITEIVADEVQFLDKKKEDSGYSQLDENDNPFN